MASRRLILMRHAKSSWKFDVADKERPLNSRGRKSAAGVAEELARLGRIPSLVLSSDARRTRETLELMNLKGSESKFLPSFYGIFGKPATSVIMEQVWKHAARGHEGTMEEPNTVMVLGHNAGWELALNDLVGPLAVPLVMKTADCFVLEPSKGSLDSGWEDIFTSFGKWRVEHHIRSRSLLPDSASS